MSDDKKDRHKKDKYPWVWAKIATFMDDKELDRLFDEKSQWNHVRAVTRKQKKQRVDDGASPRRHPLKRLAGLNVFTRAHRESDYILGKVLEESQEPPHREQPSDGENALVHPLKEIKLDPGELWFRYRVDKIAFGSKENFESVCNKLGIDPTSDPIQWNREFYWIASDKKAVLWCYSDPREGEDYYPRFFELTGLRERIIRTADSHNCWDDYSGIGRLIVWQDAPWLKK